MTGEILHLLQNVGIHHAVGLRGIPSSCKGTEDPHDDLQPDVESLPT